MLNKLIDVLLDFIGLFQFWVIIDPIEVGIVITLGRDTAYLTSENGWFGTGFHLVAPFDLEEVKVVNIQFDWDSVYYQSVETKDGKPYIVHVGYKYKLRAEEAKIRKFVVQLNDEQLTRRHAIGAAVCTTISDSTEEELKKRETKGETITPEGGDDESDTVYEGIKKRILDYARKELTPWGYRIAKIEWLQRTPSKTYRIMQDSAAATTVLPEEEEEE